MKTLRLLAPALVLALLVFSCASKGWNRQVKMKGKAIDLVLREVQGAPELGSLLLEAEPFLDGVVLLGTWLADAYLEPRPEPAVFWVERNTVYVVNERARAMAPHLEQAPEDITLDFVNRVVGEARQAGRPAAFPQSAPSVFEGGPAGKP